MSKPRKLITRVGHDTQLDGRDICLEFDRTTAFERSYENADADGQRGQWMDMVTEDYATNITVYWYDGVDGARVDKLEHLTEGQRAAVQKLADDWLEANEPEYREEEEPDWDAVRELREERKIDDGR